MSATHSFADIDIGGVGVVGGGGSVGRRRRRRGRSSRRRRRPSVAFSGEAVTTDGGSSLGFSDSDDQSSAHLDSSIAGDECGSSGIFSYNHSHRESLSDEIDLESGELEVKVHSKGKDEKQCRICHLNFEVAGGGDDREAAEDGGGGGDIQLGCNCKGDLGAAHKQCAETWFKIKGNMICEICGATARNVAGEVTNNGGNADEIETTEASTTAPILLPSEPRSFWQGRRIMNILLGCMVFAFIISWLFHFNILP